MDPSFRFDPDGSDDELAAAGPHARGKPAQSAWDFSSYAESVAAEHARRRTTSIDEKISLARQGRRDPVLSDDSKADESGGSGDDERDEDEALVEGEGSGDEEDELEENEDDEEEAVEGSGDEEVEAESDGDGEDEEEGGEQEEDGGEDDEDAQEEDDEAEQDGKLDPSNFFASSEGASFHAKSFLELNLSRPLVRACEALGYQKPTPIQAACIPLALTGRDICGSAITGSGKLHLLCLYWNAFFSVQNVSLQLGCLFLLQPEN